MILACSSTGNLNQSIIDGYKEELIDGGANHFRVVYEGSQWINKSDAEAQKVVDYSLLRSAELSLENDFPFLSFFPMIRKPERSSEMIRFVL